MPSSADLYASGLDEDQLQQLANEANWEDFFNDVPSRDDRTFHRKRDDDLFLVKQGAGLKNGRIGLPMGLVQGQDIDLFLTRVMLPVGHVVNFYDLPIAFNAVAVDMVTGEAVILERGSIAQAIRASMSVPAAVAPIEIDGRLLGDGGVVQNLPIDTVRPMGADVVIAVDISTPLATRDELTSLVSITGQLVGFLTRRGTAEQIERLTANDVLIRPELGDIGSVVFERIEETIPPVTPRRWRSSTSSSRSRCRRIRMSPTALHGQIHASTPRRASTSYGSRTTRMWPITSSKRGWSRSRPGCRSISMRRSARSRGFMVSSCFSTSATPSSRKPRERLSRSQWMSARGGPDYLQFGLQYSAAGSDESLFGLSLSYLRTAMNSLGAEWRSTIALGDEPELSTVWHQPLGRNALTFVTAGLALESPLVNVYEASERIARVRSDEANVEFALGRELDNWGELRFGFLRGMGEPELDTGDRAAIPLADFDRAEIYARFTIDTLDSLYFPKDGNLLVAERRSSEEHLGASTEYEQFSARLMTAHTFGRHAVAFGLRYDTTIDGVAPPWKQFEIGGFWDLSGFAKNELSGQNAGHLIRGVLPADRQVRSYADLRGHHTREKERVADARRALARQLTQCWIALDRGRHADRADVPLVRSCRRRPRQYLLRDRQRLERRKALYGYEDRSSPVGNVGRHARDRCNRLDQPEDATSTRAHPRRGALSGNALRRFHRRMLASAHRRVSTHAGETGDVRAFACAAQPRTPLRVREGAHGGRAPPRAHHGPVLLEQLVSP